MEGRGIGTVKILGLGCPACQETTRRVFNVLAELEVDADVQEVRDVAEIARLGVRFTPAVIVGNDVMVQGRVPKAEELRKWFLERVPAPTSTK